MMKLEKINKLYEKISNKKIAIKKTRMKIKIKNKLKGKNNFLIDG